MAYPTPVHIRYWNCLGGKVRLEHRHGENRVPTLRMRQTLEDQHESLANLHGMPSRNGYVTINKLDLMGEHGTSDGTPPGNLI